MVFSLKDARSSIFRALDRSAQIPIEIDINLDSGGVNLITCKQSASPTTSLSHLPTVRLTYRLAPDQGMDRFTRSDGKPSSA